MAKWKNKKEFKDRVYKFATHIDVTVKSLYLRPMRNKWASCSSKGNFNFNEQLLDMDKKIGDYVIVHEMLHLIVPNHGKLWKSLMRTYIKDYEKIQDKLNKGDEMKKKNKTKEKKMYATFKKKDYDLSMFKEKPAKKEKKVRSKGLTKITNYSIFNDKPTNKEKKVRSKGLTKITDYSIFKDKPKKK